MPFADRQEAGRLLAKAIHVSPTEHPIVLALPRGGVVVGAEVARALHAPLDVVLVRKLGAPAQPEFGFGAVGEDGAITVDRPSVRELGLRPDDIDRIAQRELETIEQRAVLYRQGRPLPNLRGRTVIVVDDGIATGNTVRAALQTVREQHPRRIILAVPTASPRAIEELELLVDELIYLEAPEGFRSVGGSYRSFGQTSDEEVIALLREQHRPREREVEIALPEVTLQGTLTMPENAHGIVLFAHGSGSSRFSPRNRFVAGQLQREGLATLLFDLLSPDEERVDLRRMNYRFDIDLLARRLVGATDWLDATGLRQGQRIGYFGSSTGAAAALIAAAMRPSTTGAVVSRGGRPDLAGAALPHVQAPTLLIVGGADTLVIELNETALEQLTCPRRLLLVPDATHLFEERGALEQVAKLAAAWFREHLVGAESAAHP